jgi:hypothetical protein
MKNISFLVLTFTFLISTSYAKPKYAATTVRALDATRYVKKNAAPDFWAMIFHYVPQGENMCQTATMSVIFNALRNQEELDSETKNITQADIIEKMNDPEWVKAMKDKKCFSLDRFSELLKKALTTYFKDQYSVKVVHVDSLDSKSIKTYLKDFSENEKSAKNFILANFDQAVFTGESESAGHISPVAAYDAKSKRMMILDVDREWYTPYWVPTSEFFKALATRDTHADKFRGYIVISPNQ